jgi:hypothetical protein
MHTLTYTHKHTGANTRARASAPKRTHARTHAHTHVRMHTHAHIQVRGGGLTQLDMSEKEGLPVAVAAAGLLERSAATLTRLDVRSETRVRTCVPQTCVHMRA